MSSSGGVEAWCVELRGWLPDERTCGGRVRCYCFRRCCAWFTWLSFLRRCCGWRTCLSFLRRCCIWCSGLHSPWWMWCALCLVVSSAPSILITWLLDSHAVQTRSLNIRLLFALFVSNLRHDGFQTARNRIAGLHMTLQTFRGDVLAHRCLTRHPLTRVRMRRRCFGGHLRQPQFEKQVPATFRQLSAQSASSSAGASAQLAMQT